MRLRNIALLVLVLLAFTVPSWAIGIAGSAGGKRVTVSVDGTWQGTYVAGTTYAIGDIVTDGTTNYRSLQNSNTGHTPASSSLYWQAILVKGDTGPTGATGSQGPTGAAGADGKTVLTTSGTPASSTGVDGDYAYDPDTYTMYGPKASGAWPAGTIIKGADGAGFTGGSDGTYGWLTDSNTSSYTECASGKYGLNFVGGVLYQCSNGTNSVFASGDSLPTQTGNIGKYLTTNGSAASWVSIAAGSGIAISADIPTETGAANLNDSTHILSVASSTGITQFTGSFTAWDTTPDAFAFTDLTDAALSTTQTATPIQITGINYPTAVTSTGGTAAICTGATADTCGTFSASPGNVALNQYVSAQHTSSGSNSTAVNTVVTIGGVSDTFTSMTAAGGGPAFSDNFSTDSSANYATIGTESLNGITVASGYAVAKNRWATNNVIRGSAGSASHYAQAKIQYHAVDASGLIVGASDAGSTTTTGYQVIPSSTTLMKLRSISGNTVTNRGEWTVPEMTVDTYYTVKVIKSGSTFALYLNGTHITPDVTDTTYTDGQYIGLSFDCSNGVFSPADDFEGGL